MSSREIIRSGLRRLDRLPSVSAAITGLMVGSLAGTGIALSSNPGLVIAFGAVLALASALALTAEPVAVESPVRVEPRGPIPGEERIHATDGTVLIYVPEGEYFLGAEDLEALLAETYSAEQAAEWAGWSKPVHRTRLSGFWIAKHPVTNEQYRRFLEANPEHPKPEYWHQERFSEDRQPVVGVSWIEARSYCAWAGLTLPSEAQWEAAARSTDQRRYPWGDELPTGELADYGQIFGSGKPQSIGSHPLGAGPFGTLDQAGGVWEWCLDGWDPRAYENRDGQTDPVSEPGEAESGDRVLRGGSWDDPAAGLAAAFRVRGGSSLRSLGVGFRCVLPSPAEHES